jgi:Spy/CpxP family protein refolding chaperone
MEAVDKRGDKGFNVDRMAKKLDLSDDQRTQIDGIMAAAKQQMKDQHDKLRANREQLKSLMRQSPLDETALRKVADAQGDLEADMIVLRAQQRAKIGDILTEEQRVKLADRAGKRRAHR